MDLTLQLSETEARVVGALIEKAFVTPDIYPMTTNALVSACNQKTNRDPVVSFDAVTIDAALLELRQRNIVRRVHTQGSRSTKHRHAFDEVHELDEGELALVSVLLLRGPQTVGELRLRTERHVRFESLDQVEETLDGLAARPSPLVRQLGRQPGQKEARWMHLLSGDEEPLGAPSGDLSAPAKRAAPEAPALTDQDLAARVAELESEIETLRSQLHSLAEQLGERLA